MYDSERDVEFMDIIKTFSNNDLLLPVDAFIRSLAVNKGRPICMLLGAGASITSGMLSAEHCIWEWKKDIFITNNPILRDTVGELSLPGTRQKIQKWLDLRGSFPQEGSSEEYSFYAQACYPTTSDRRRFFQSFVAESSPHIGYKLLPLLAKDSIIRTVWTTNFDGLVARSCAAANVVNIEIGIDCTQRIARQPSAKELRIVSLHGDYRYDDLKNTEKELQDQEILLRDEMIHELKDYDIVVIGYSGRDASILSVLSESFTQQNESRLFWCSIGNEAPAHVAELLGKARAACRESYYIPIDGFDDVVTRMALRLLDGSLLADAKSILASSEDRLKGPAAFLSHSLPTTSLVKSNAYQLSIPREVLKLELIIPEAIKPREWLEGKLRPDIGSLVSMSGGALAIAAAEDLQRAFGTNLRSSPVAISISEQEISSDKRIQSLYRRALIVSLSRFLNAETDFAKRIWERTHYTTNSYMGKTYRIHRALSCPLAFLDKRLHVVLIPEVVVMLPTGEVADTEAIKTIRNGIYGYQHNDIYDQDIKRWTDRITAVDIPANGGGVFRITRAPLYAGLAQKGRSPLGSTLQGHAKQNGLVLADANLVFCAADGKSEAKNQNPLKGLVDNRPWDFQVTATGLCSSVDTATICPRSFTQLLRPFLNLLSESSQPADSEKDYLQAFPGFARAFGLAMTQPLPGEPLWIQLDDNVDGDGLSAARELAQRICSALDSIRSIRPGAVVVIFIPTQWAPYKIIETTEERFNLHDYIKAYAARHGQSTQLLREETIRTVQPCRVRWWLSLALYAKALRTPWLLDSIDEETAFAGIGYSMDAFSSADKHILLGCSHLYSARGEGLQFRLGRIENPIMRGKNPFMSEDDARRVGETIRQLFYESKTHLPRRVVIHKRTPFMKDEQRGLVKGLDGVPDIELIEVNVEESLRYLASRSDNGKLTIDGFPIPRGAVIIQDSSSALLWVHGSAPSAIGINRRYYQGKRRIPAPLLIRRYIGQSDIIQVATEILGLSKMNWNTFDYYSRLPATLDSAGAIASLGTYLTGFGSAPYDYRLLI